jgi:hypothetical protein
MAEATKLLRAPEIRFDFLSLFLDHCRRFVPVVVIVKGVIVRVVIVRVGHDNLLERLRKANRLLGSLCHTGWR